jgi:hypothetical protein
MRPRMRKPHRICLSAGAYDPNTVLCLNVEGLAYTTWSADRLRGPTRACNSHMTAPCSHGVSTRASWTSLNVQCTETLDGSTNMCAFGETAETHIAHVRRSQAGARAPELPRSSSCTARECGGFATSSGGLLWNRPENKPRGMMSRDLPSSHSLSKILASQLQLGRGAAFEEQHQRVKPCRLKTGQRGQTRLCNSCCSFFDKVRFSLRFVGTWAGPCGPHPVALLDAGHFSQQHPATNQLSTLRGQDLGTYATVRASAGGLPLAACRSRS